jgi:hypothetical protein
MRGIRLYAMFTAIFMAGAFLASPELRAYAANTIGSADIINNSIQSVDIKDGEVKTADLGGNSVTAAKIKDSEVKAAEIATDAVGSDEIVTNAVGAAEIATNAVGASEIAGVSTLAFAECTRTFNSISIPGGGPVFLCDVAGVGPGDVAIATINGDADGCFAITKTNVLTNKVSVIVGNTCPVDRILGTANMAIMVFDTASVIIPPI